jgi:hypothetical protein
MNQDSPPTMDLARNYLLERGISEETIKAHGIELDTFITDQKVRDRLKRKSLKKTARELIWFPLFDDGGAIESWIVRPLPNLPGEPKFLCPNASSAPPYIPQGFYSLKAGHPLIITEGPVKALACLQASTAAIGLNGVWGAGIRTEEGIKIRADLYNALDWRGRRVYLAFDADLATNPEVRQAWVRLFLLLCSVGAESYHLRWDLAQGKGIDDYLVSQTQRNGQHPPQETLAGLIGGANPFISSIQRTPFDLDLVTKELGNVFLPNVLRSQLCKELAKAVGVSADDLRDYSPKITRAGALWETDPELWPEPVDGEELLDALSALIARHVVIDEHAKTAVSLFTVLTYLTETVDVLPLLVLQSPTKRCGKTRLLGVLDRTVRRPFSCVSVTPATLYRSIEKWHPTLLIDEADNLFKDSQGNDNAELRTVINSGHTRDHAWVPRCVGDQYEVQNFSTWSPKVIALVGKLPDSMFDRSIAVQLQRRAKTDLISPLHDTPEPVWLEVRRKLFRFAADNLDAIRQTRPKLPNGLNDRAEDNWFPLLAIAAVAGPIGQP